MYIYISSEFALCTDSLVIKHQKTTQKQTNKQSKTKQTKNSFIKVLKIFWNFELDTPLFIHIIQPILKPIRVDTCVEPLYKSPCEWKVVTDILTKVSFDC